ncbi:hypothetical protein IG631_17892 [Alternaria alternata]|nr:hypothetical protein IG631_17892 [Alternaria alternata]
MSCRSRVSSAGYEVAYPQIRPSLATGRMALLIESHVELPIILARMLWGSVLSGSTAARGCAAAGGFASLPNWRTLCRRSDGIWMSRRCLMGDFCRKDWQTMTT